MDRLLFVHFLLLKGIGWDRIAAKLHIAPSSARVAYSHFMKYGIGAPGPRPPIRESVPAPLLEQLQLF